MERERKTEEVRRKEGMYRGQFRIGKCGRMCEGKDKIVNQVPSWLCV